jgi:hypothetical protein
MKRLFSAPTVINLEITEICNVKSGIVTTFGETKV